MNPYKGANFFEFLILFFKRFYLLLNPKSLVEDEIQVYALMTIGTACILVSIFMLLQKKMMIANSISHTILLGIVVFLVTIKLLFGNDVVFTSHVSINQLVIPAFISAFFTYYFTDFLIYRLKVQEDASIGIVFTFLFALSIFLVSLLGRNSHLGIEAIMGNLDAINLNDLKASFFVMLVISTFIFGFLPYLKWISFDLSYSKVLGMKVNLFNLILIFLCSLTLIVGFKSVGVVMVLALMTFPVLTARIFFHSISKLILGSILLNSIVSLVAVALSRAILTEFHLAISTSGLLVTLLGCIFFLTLGMKKIRARQ